MPGGNKKVTESLQMNVHMYHILLYKIWFWCNNCNFANLNSCNDVIALATLLGSISFLLWSVTDYWRHFLSITPERFRNIFLYAHCQYFLPLPTEYFTYIKYSMLLKKLTSLRRHACHFECGNFPLTLLSRILLCIRRGNFHCWSGTIVLFSVFSASSSAFP